MKYFRSPYIVRWIFPRRIWGFKSNKVYLTFDDGPTELVTKQILSILEEEGVKATFFCVGSNVIRFPDQYKSIIDAGHAIGNHTMDHQKGTKTPSKEYWHSIQDAKKVIDSNLFRPPYGRLSMLRSARIKRNFKIIMWSWLSYDYDKNVTIEQILESAEKDIKAGDILVLHDNIKVEGRVVELLPKLIRIIKDKGLRFDIISS